MLKPKITFLCLLQLRCPYFVLIIINFARQAQDPVLS